MLFLIQVRIFTFILYFRTFECEKAVTKTALLLHTELDCYSDYKQQNKFELNTTKKHFYCLSELFWKLVLFF